MTPATFKQRYPEYAHLEGEALWNAMEDEMLNMAKPVSKQEAEEILRLPEQPNPPLESYRMIFLDVSDE